LATGHYEPFYGEMRRYGLRFSRKPRCWALYREISADVAVPAAEGKQPRRLIADRAQVTCWKRCLPTASMRLAN